MHGHFRAGMVGYVWASVCCTQIVMMMREPIWIAYCTTYLNCHKNSKMPARLNITQVCFLQRDRLSDFHAMGCWWQVMLEDMVRHWLAKVFALRFTRDKWQAALGLK